MKQIAERLWAKTEKRGPNDCWEWQGWRHPKGHGQIGRGRKRDGLAYTHVVAWEIANGPVPEGMYVCHQCDNPPCVNPNHLFLGTPADNTHDMLRKRRHSFGEAHARKLSEQQVIEARRLLAEGVTQRVIAEQLGVSRSMIGGIGQFKKWALAESEPEVVSALLSRVPVGERDACGKGHVYSEVGFYKSAGGRVCKACHRDRMNRYMASGGREKKLATERSNRAKAAART